MLSRLERARKYVKCFFLLFELLSDEIADGSPTGATKRYNHLCTTHGSSPTSDDVVSIQRTIGTVSTGSKIVNRFEPALLYFLRRSAVQFEAGALLIG